MAREKKINIKPLLNTAVKPIQDSPLEEPKYPLYLEVTYDRKYTRFPFGDYRYPLSTSDTLIAMPDIQKAIETVEKIVRFESNRNPSFTIKGLSDIVKSYLSNLGNSLMMLLIEQVEDELKSLLTYDRYEEWKALHQIKRIPEGLKLLDGEGSNQIDKILASIQLTLPDGSAMLHRIIDWLIYTGVEAKIDAVKTSLSIDLSDTLYADKGGVGKLSKKVTPKELVNIIDELCLLSIDKQVVTGVKYH